MRVPSVQRVLLDGVERPHPWVRHAQLARSATLHFVLGDAPGAWGRDFGTP